uniref:DUF3615 domain-containing protein n=1 Tax=Arundo donax TaxID=35708 RepID=A0A0A9HZ15_ARUDO
MDPGDETTPTSGRTRTRSGAPPEATTRHSDPPRPDRPQAMEVDEVASHPSQLIEDVQPEAKRARACQIPTPRRRPPIHKIPEPYWMKSDWTKYRTDEAGLKMADHVRIVGQALREYIERLELNAGIKQDENVLSEKAEEVIHPSDAGRFQHVEELKPPGEEQATLNLESIGHLSELPLQPEEAKLQGGLSCSNTPPGEYCMSDKFVERLDKKAKLYFGRKKELGEEEIIANGFQFMKEEAFLAFRNYIAENDLFEDFDYRFDEVLHHCFSIEEYRKVYCHYNFTIKMKKNDEDCWTSKLYFAEAKLLNGVKYYFCSPLELTDSGQCYSCTNKRVNELKHPSGGGYEKGHKGSGSHYPSDECGMCHIFFVSFSC